jgi:hypothetical protein
MGMQRFEVGRRVAFRLRPLSGAPQSFIASNLKVALGEDPMRAIGGRGG